MIFIVFSFVFYKGIGWIGCRGGFAEMHWRNWSSKPHQKLIWFIPHKKRVITIQKLLGNRMLACRSDFGTGQNFFENLDFLVFSVFFDGFHSIFIGFLMGIRAPLGLKSKKSKKNSKILDRSKKIFFGKVENIFEYQDRRKISLRIEWEHS